MVCIIWSCACYRSPSRGWSVRRILLPYCLHPPYGASGICPLVFLPDVFQTPWTFGENFEDSALFLRFLILLFSVQRFPEEAPKLLEKFLIVLLTFSEEGIRRCRKPCCLSPRELALFFPYDLFGGLCSWRRIFWSSHARLEEFSLGSSSLVLLSLFGELRSSRKVCSAIASNVSGSLHLSVYFYHLVT